MSLFTKLAMVAIMSSNTPQDISKAWQTKLACEDETMVHEAYLSGLTGKLVKKAATRDDTYILASEMGKELGINILYNMKRGIN